MKNNFSLWIIGPSAAGKTSVSKIIYEKIKKKIPNLIIVDGDKVRDLYEKNLGYDKISRSKNTIRYVNLVEWCTSQTHHVKCLTMHCQIDYTIINHMFVW